MRYLAFRDERTPNVSPKPVREQHAPRKGNLLMVDPDDFLVEMIEAGLTLARPKWGVVATRHPSEALDVLSRYSEFDAILTEVVFERSADIGKAFIHEVSDRWDIPMFAMTQLDAEAIRGVDVAEYIAKPPDIDFLVGRVDRIIRRQRESRVRGISLPTFLQILEIERKTCTIVVSHQGRIGEVFLRDGKLVQARVDGIDGEDAFFRILNMKENSLRLLDRCDAERTIAASLASLLMEWSVRQDHDRRPEEAG